MSDAQHEQILRLLGELLVRSETGSAPWEAISPYSFGLQTKDASVEIRSRDQDDSHPIELILYNSDFEVIDYLISEWYGVDDPASWNSDIERLYFEAKAKANNVGHVIEEFLEDLDHGSILKWSKPDARPATYAFDEEPF
jgi:hypothetical protein